MIIIMMEGGYITNLLTDNVDLINTDVVLYDPDSICGDSNSCKNINGVEVDMYRVRIEEADPEFVKNVKKEMDIV